MAHVCCTGDNGLQTRGSLLLRRPYRPGLPRALGCSPRRRVPLPCLAQARTFQPGSGSGAGEQRQEVVSQALAAAAEVPLTRPGPLRLHEPPSVEEQLRQLQKLSQMLWAANTYEDKVKVLECYSPVADFLNTREGKAISTRLAGLTPLEGYVLLCLPAIGQEHVLTLLPSGVDVAAALRQLEDALCGVEHFYDSIGGLVGYQRQCLQLICQQQQATAAQQAEQGQHSIGASTAAGSAKHAPSTQFLVPEGINLADPGHSAHATAASLAGLEALPALAEIYPLGGAGDRLGLRCEVTGECLPTAVLQYCGKSLLEVLVRDLQAREYLHWRVHGTQQTTPVAIMTSAAKGNHWRVEAAFEAAGWFGRGRESFRLFQQPLVPMVAGEDGRWLLAAPLQPLLKPGGHGVIWKLMLDSGVFDWLRGLGREAAIVRQISNPMAGVDNTLLALAGSGHSGRHSFGFASCERAVGASEGINVLVQQHVPGRRTGEPGRYEYCVTNVEYTEFERLGFADEQAADGSNVSKFPANTNVLYVGLQAAEGLVRDSVARGTTDAILPGMILNLKKKVSFFDAWLGRERSVAAGRLECTMQNLADLLVTRSSRALEGCERQLDTFVLYNQRRKVTSSAKRKLKPGSDQIHQTPDGSFYTLQQNARDLLLRCGFDVPEVGAVPDYLSRGPGFMFLFHPALGPLWDVVAQKLRGGRLAPRSELVLEVAEADVEGLHLQGSLLVHAECVMGQLEVPAGAPSAGPQQAMQQHVVAHSPASKAGRKVHNGVEHRPTVKGAYGSVSLAQPVGTTMSSSEQTSGTAAGAAEVAAGGVPPAEPRLVYSDRCGRVRLRNVRVQNRGVDWEHPDNIYWRHKVARHESARIVLHGRSEFEAHDVTLAGDLAFEVPDGHRMTVTAGAAGEPVVQLAALGPHPSWSWAYTVAASSGGGGGAGGVVLQLIEASPALLS